MQRLFRNLVISFAMVMAFTFFAQAAFISQENLRIKCPDNKYELCSYTGDEFLGYLEDSDGYTVLYSSAYSGYYYAVPGHLDHTQKVMLLK